MTITPSRRRAAAAVLATAGALPHPAPDTS